MKRLLVVPVALASLACTTPDALVSSPEAMEFTTPRPAYEVVPFIAAAWSKHVQGVTVVPVPDGTLLSTPGPDIAVKVWEAGGTTHVRYKIRPLIYTPDWMEEPLKALK